MSSDEEIKEEIMRGVAIEWLKQNTTFDITQTTYPSNVEMFILKYEEIMSLRPGVASESISGLSQSFTGEISALLKQYAAELIGEKFLIGDVRFVSAEKAWK